MNETSVVEKATAEWTEAASAVPNLSYAYYPGCSLSGTAVEYGMSTRALCARLGIDLDEVPDWICCGATPAHAIRHLFPIALGVRNLALAAKLGKPVLTVCAACFNRLKVASHELRTDEEVRVKLEQLPDLFNGVTLDEIGSLEIHHLLDVLHDAYGIEALKNKVTHPLEGLKVACYYGCLLIRPPKIMQFDDAENPHLMDELVAAVGAEAVEWAFKTECCGASLTLTRSDLTIERVHLILSDARDAGADIVCVACPLCHVNLDLYQPDADAHFQTKHDMPILYFTQLIGLAVGIPPNELGLNKHRINPMSLLKEKGIVSG